MKITTMEAETVTEILEILKQLSIDVYAGQSNEETEKVLGILIEKVESLSLPSVITQLEQEHPDRKFIDWVNHYFEDPKTEIYYRRKLDGKKISQSEMIIKYKRAFVL